MMDDSILESESETGNFFEFLLRQRLLSFSHSVLFFKLEVHFLIIEGVQIKHHVILRQLLGFREGRP